MEAHESSLRALALTEDGTKLATASNKGTVIRVWDVATAACVVEFRRGVERVQMTGLSWSWDHQHLACCSDKGTTHVFSMKEGSDHQTNKAKKSLATKLFGAVRNSIMDVDQPKSISQIRGVPHPQACAFVPDLPNTLAVVGYDLDGNGVLLLSDYSSEEATKVGYHVIVQTRTEDDDELLSEGETRRNRMLATVSPPQQHKEKQQQEQQQQGEAGGKLYVGERLEVLEDQMKEIRFEEQEEGFLDVSGFETTPNANNNDLAPDAVTPNEDNLSPTSTPTPASQ